jgi:predicted DNA-binding protein with PD1-like motif
MRQLQHPGPPQLCTEQLPALLLPFEARLAPGQTLLAAVTRVFAELGADSGVARLRGGRWSVWPYVLPALSRSPAHAVYFSERHEADAPVDLEEATLTFGRRGDRPWLHAHVDWTDRAGVPHCGHVLPDEAVLADDGAQLDGWALRGAAFEVMPDGETHFSLFRPTPEAGPERPIPSTEATAVALRVSPNLDLCTALESVCAAHGWTRARVRGGVGSTIGAVFDDGRIVKPFVTETLIRQGEIRSGADGRPQAQIDVTLIDHLGGRHQGRLARGENPVLVTFELVLEALPGSLAGLG